MTGFSGAKILITGAGSGIGAASASRLAEAGASLILADRDAAALHSFGEAHVRLVGEVTDETLWDGADLTGLTHALINAGIGDSGPIESLDFAAWRRVLSVNLDGAFLTLRAAMRAIRATGRGGAIVMVGSVVGMKAEPGIAAYGASKAAVIHLAKLAAKEAAGAGIRVNAIAPGGVETPIWADMPFFQDLIAKTGSEAAAYAEMAKATPLGRYAKPDEIAAQITFLLSDEAAYITGACLVTDGGYTL